jgi:DsbC/DsbD-like thiol-disulfide interchange protein
VFGIQTKEQQLGVAYPAIFVVDEGGRVVGKRIGENYRVREGTLKLLEEGLGVELLPAGPQGTAAANRVSVTTVTDSAEYVRWQESRLRLIFDIDPGWHIYGRPIPDGYRALAVELKGIPEVEVHPAQYPQPRPFRVEGLDEDFQVYEGRFVVLVPFAVRVAPGHGEIELKIAVTFQACSKTECLPPDGVYLELRLGEAATP